MVEPLRLGLAGLGTVGSATVRMLARSREELAARAGRPIEIKAYASKDPPKDNTIDLSKIRKVESPAALAADPDIDVFVELMGGEGDPAKDAVEAALKAGHGVVTANKALIAKHGVALAKLAEQKNAAFSFEAAVAGGIPIVKTLREGLGGARISRIYGILNGTCNYILTQMQKEGALLRRLPEGSAEARLCRSRSDLRHRRLRHRAQDRDPHQHRLRYRDRRRSDLHRGHSVDHAC